MPPAFSAPRLQKRSSMSPCKPTLSQQPGFEPVPSCPIDLELRSAYLAAMTTGRLSARQSRDASARSLESLLNHASDLLFSMSAQDSRSRLLQTALLRRDHALLRAVVHSVDEARVESASRRLWASMRPKARRTSGTKRASERPTYRPQHHSLLTE
jgi:hypothetical protein